MVDEGDGRSKRSNDRASLVAAAIILLVVGIIFFFMPSMMLALGEISPWLAYGAAILFIGAFFLVFWLRGRSQTRRGDGSGR